MFVNEIKFSVIVPVYNVEKYLRQCIESILSQTYPNFELILVNDGSTDSCGEICEEYRTKDKRIRIIHQENRGLLAARRVGIRAAEGGYFIHVDSDDYCETTLLEKLYGKIVETQCDLLLYGYARADNAGNTVKSFLPSRLPAIDGYIPKEELIKAMLSGTDYNPIWMKCSKNTIVDIDADYSKYGRLMIGEDLLQSIPLVENAEKICVIEESLYIYRQVSGSMSRQIRKDYIHHFVMIFNRFYEMVRRCCTQDSTLQQFYCYYHHRLTGWLIRSTLVYNRREYSRLIDQIKPHVIPVPYGYYSFSSPADRVCFQFAMRKWYLLSKSVARYLMNRNK